MVSYDDVRQVFSSRTAIPSNMGLLLERLREGRTTGSGDIRYAQMKDEVERLKLARIYRCIDGLASIASIRYARHEFTIRDLRNFARKAGQGDGETVVRILCEYEPWAVQWPEKGLAQVYNYARSRDPELRALKVDGDEAAQAFRSGKCIGARQLASALVADAHVALGEWVRIFSKRESENDNGRRNAS